MFRAAFSLYGLLLWRVMVGRDRRVDCGRGVVVVHGGWV